MAVSNSRITQDITQHDLLEIFLSGMRQRFKHEVNRLTSGAMRAMLVERTDADDLSFLMSYLYAWHWLDYHVHQNYHEQVLASFRGPKFGFLMDLLLSASAEEFVQGYIQHWLSTAEGPLQREQLLRLVAAQHNDPQVLAADILSVWQGFGLFSKTYMVDFKQVGREERQRYEGMLGAEDLARLALVDALPEPKDTCTATPYSKLGIIPAMGCPQTCRHCMFTWRPPRPKHEQPGLIYEMVDAHTDSVLFTGGDLTKQMNYFYDAIRRMRHVKNFAILLNGDFADTPELANSVLGAMAEAIDSRPRKWVTARVLLQISFDEFHQEVYVDKKGRLAERIPVAKIANIVEAYPRYAAQIQLALLHKQTSLNFSMDVLHKGVFARLTNELARRGHTLQVLSATPSPRQKRNPLAPDAPGTVLKDASFILVKYPDAPILLTSSTIDGYGRAALLDEWETVKEKDLLHEVLEGRIPPGESFDIDMMFWFNGWVTLFNAVHICLGDVYQDGIEVILSRQRKDPLSQALQHFDRRIIEFYCEVRDNVERKISEATGPHHLFHALTEEPEVRLHLTQRLIDTVIE